MARLINADELKKNFQDELCKGIACAECSMQAEGFCRVERWIDIAPTAEPTKHGTWGENIYGYRKCSVCGRVTQVDECMREPLYLYCPNCGARMDGGENE